MINSLMLPVRRADEQKFFLNLLLSAAADPEKSVVRLRRTDEERATYLPADHFAERGKMQRKRCFF